MKDYEDRFRYKLPRRTNTLIRLDGKAFHSYTRGCKKPFDDALMSDMDTTAIRLCEQIQGCKLAYIQSDEITLWLTDYDDIGTAAWFDGNIQKIASVSASIATAEFNKARTKRCLEEAQELGCINSDISMWGDFTVACFDSRVWSINELTEVANTFVWRSQDASRNSVQMYARSMYSHKELDGKNTSALHDLIHVKGENWNDLASRYKRGRIVYRNTFSIPVSEPVGDSCIRHVWGVDEMEGYNFEYWYTLLLSRLGHKLT